MIHLTLTEDQYDTLMKALLRQAQRHRGKPEGNRYDELCEALDAQASHGHSGDLQLEPEQSFEGYVDDVQHRRQSAMERLPDDTRGLPPSPFDAATMSTRYEVMETLPSGRKATEVQTLLFQREFFTEAEAKKWARDHNFLYGKVDRTEDYWRLRQRDPAGFRNGTFRTIDFRPGVKAVIGIPRGR